MKRLFFIVLLINLVFDPIYSQDKKINVKTGAGYYLDTMGLVDGLIIWIEGGFKLGTSFNLNSRISMADITWEMSNGEFKGYQTIALRQMIDLTFSRSIKISGAHFLEPGLGFKLKREYNLYPDFGIYDSSGGPVLYTKYSDIFYEIGLTFSLDYYYQFETGFFMGIRTDINRMYALGFEGLTISPIIGFRF